MKKLVFLSLIAFCIFSGCKVSVSDNKASSEGIHPVSIGFQLYSVRNDLEKDFYGTLKKVRDMA